MRISYVEVCGFRGYSKSTRIDFANGFTIIDGRNGVGKSSVFDAIEFVLLGHIAKYGDAKAAGESASDYIWWRGRGSTPTARYVEVGFDLNGEIIALRRTMIEPPDASKYQRVIEGLLTTERAPDEALRQLCSATIIRDEKIAELSLDLREADRFRLLRDALGASDAEAWTSRADAIHRMARKRLQAAEAEVDQAIIAVNVATQRADETRQLLADESVVTEATSRLRNVLLLSASGPELFKLSSEAIERMSSEAERLASIADRWSAVETARQRLQDIRGELEAAQAQELAHQAQVEHLEAQLGGSPSSAEYKSRVATYANLIANGRAVGLQDGACPLCAAEQTEELFERGIEIATTRVASLDEEALARSEVEQLYQSTVAAHASSLLALQRVVSSSNEARRQVSEFDGQLANLGFSDSPSLEAVTRRREELRSQIETIRRDLALADNRRSLSTLQFSLAGVEDARRRRAATEESLTGARRAETRAKVIYDACRRSSGEVLQKRLEVVMPLMSELYQRLRPHPMWEDIDYKLRGDVQKFLTLKVGENLNPQFIYSSGQRRATGLAFLLAVNLSLAWNKWKTLMLDDPVQHIDDFRSIHLAEVLGKLALSGRQIICAAEDAALASLLARHLPVTDSYVGKRVTLGVNKDGALAVLAEETIAPLPASTFIIASPQSSVG